MSERTGEGSNHSRGRKSFDETMVAEGGGEGLTIVKKTKSSLF